MEKREHASVDLQREEKKQSTKAGPQCIGGIVSLLRRGEIFQCIALQDRSRVQWLPRWCHRSTHTYYSPRHACGSTSIITIPLKWPWNFQVWSLHAQHSDNITRSCVLWCQDCLAWDAVGDVILSNKRTVVPFQHLMKECLVGNGLSASRWLPVSNLRLDHH